MSDENILIENTQPVDIEEELKRSYLDYAMSVIIGRALPDVRDGLKPVHRRVLYGMWEGGNRAGRPYKKSARIVGEVMGKYHPHGDSAIYDTVVRMAQDFSMRYPLIDGQGNFGSLDGDNPAAMRYTEIRLTRLSEEMLREDIDKETVPWIPNYDESEREPVVLPTRFPNLLVTGAAGIAVGMATNIPPHNLSEVIDAVILMIDKPDVTVLELMSVLPGPDFPTGGYIYGINGIAEAYSTGRGSIQMRARCTVEDIGKDRQQLVFSETPYQVNKAKLVEYIAALVKDKRIEGISDLRDESDRQGIRIVVELKRGEIPEVVQNQLYKLSKLQTSFGINMVAIVDNQPRILSLPKILRHFIDHRKTVVIRRVRFDLRKAEHRGHILEGLLKALDHIDEIITTIRSSATPDEAKASLMERFTFTEIQAQAILEMRLQRLTGLEREKLVAEYAEVMAVIERLRAILGSDELLLQEIRGELEEIKDSYGDKRRTEIVGETHDITIEDMIADEDMVITVSNAGYVKRSPLTEYREQGRGGKGRKGMQTKEGDFVKHLYVASAHSYVLVFTEAGRLYWLKVHQIPALGPASRGKAIVNLLNLAPDEKIATTAAVREFDEGYLVFATRNGTVKKTELKAYSNVRAGGINAIIIDEGDRLLNVRVSDGEHEVFLATANGMAIRFPESDARPMGRVTRGVRGIALADDDQVVSMEVLDEAGDIFTVSQDGMGKRTAREDYRLQSRGGKGVINIKLNEETGRVVGSMQVNYGDGVVLITQDGKLLRISVNDFRVIGRSTQGVRVIRLGEDDRLVSVAKIVERDDKDEDDDSVADGGAEAADGAAEGEGGAEEPVN